MGHGGTPRSLDGIFFMENPHLAPQEMAGGNSEEVREQRSCSSLIDPRCWRIRYKDHQFHRVHLGPW